MSTATVEFYAALKKKKSYYHPEINRKRYVDREQGPKSAQKIIKVRNRALRSRYAIAKHNSQEEYLITENDSFTLEAPDLISNENLLNASFFF